MSKKKYIELGDALKAFTYNSEGKRIPETDIDNFPVTISIREIKKKLRGLPTYEFEAPSENVKIATIKRIIEYANSVWGTSYRTTTTATQRAISGRMKDKYTEEDIKLVIDYMYKRWGNDKEMSKFLRPQTIFGTKFESYYEEAKRNMPKKPVVSEIELDMNEPELSDEEWLEMMKGKK